MAFEKDVTIYKSEITHIYINECRREHRKTKIYAIRRDDNVGLAHFLGTIMFSGRWRQYVFSPEAMTIWSSGCLDGITRFMDDRTQRWREKLKTKAK